MSVTTCIQALGRLNQKGYKSEVSPSYRVGICLKTTKQKKNYGFNSVVRELS